MSMRDARRGVRPTILLVGCAMLAPVEESLAQQAPASHGWSSIIDGRSLAGWTGGSAFTVENGTLVGRGNGALTPLCTEQAYGDFVLRFRSRASDRATSAVVLVRAQPAAGAGARAGLATPLASAALGDLRNASGRLLARADQAALGRIRDTAEWVDHAIYANAGQVRIFVNGRLLLDHID